MVSTRESSLHTRSARFSIVFLFRGEYTRQGSDRGREANEAEWGGAVAVGS
jgi:hypothetical protein